MIEISDAGNWLADQFEGLADSVINIEPSEWAEANRYLPPQVTPMPGYYSYRVTPYLREIVDCLSVQSPVREIAVIKGVQLGATVGILENAIGYYIDHVKTAPLMLVTADGELAKIRMESYIIPMIQYSGLSERIKSSDPTNNRRTGLTQKKMEWEGGGFLLPFGAQNADKLRSVSIRVQLRDEIDTWPDIVGKQGDPLELTQGRTKAYESSRKILDISTPLIKGQSKITSRYMRGDQRKYFVRCKSCGFHQVLNWRTNDKGRGGIVWDTDKGLLVRGSVRYLCVECGHAHVNDDKTTLLDPEHGAAWKPTVTSVAPFVRSYFINSLYSPPGFQSWESCVDQWLEAWDTEHKRVKDMGLFQVFYNNVLGEAFEIRGDRVKFSAVSAHRRREYQLGEVPNMHAEEFTGAPILFLVCVVDVQDNDLSVSVWGCARERRKYLIDYWKFEGDTSNLQNPDTWGRLRETIQSEYRADDGREYRIVQTLVDCGYKHETVLSFCKDYTSGVNPIRGVDTMPKNAAIREFNEFKTKMGTVGLNVNVSLYKDRWSAALRRVWDGLSVQPAPFFNAPIDTTDEQLKELTRETKREKRDSAGRIVGYEWHRTGANELWDLLVYGDAAVDMIAWHTCINHLGLSAVAWTAFYDLMQSHLPAKVPA